MKQTEFPTFVLRLALGKAFEAGRHRGWDERDLDPDEYVFPDFETWYRKEMKLDEKNAEEQEN